MLLSLNSILWLLYTCSVCIPSDRTFALRTFCPWQTARGCQDVSSLQCTEEPTLEAVSVGTDLGPRLSTEKCTEEPTLEAVSAGTDLKTRSPALTQSTENLRCWGFSDHTQPRTAANVFICNASLTRLWTGPEKSSSLQSYGWRKRKTLLQVTNS